MTETTAHSRPRLPVPARAARFFILLAVFICAACGLVYELALVAIGSYLLGDTITQASVVLSVMVFAMGVGSLLSKRYQARPALSFAVVEGLLSLVGGLSVLLLYGSFAWLSVNAYQPTLVLLAFVIGTLIGIEIPLLMTLIQRIRKQEASEAVADLFAADYVGGLIGGLAFPFLLLPLLGLPKGALMVGLLNAVIGVAVVLWLFRTDLTRLAYVGLSAGLTFIVVVLGLAYYFAEHFEVDARQAMYRDPIAYAERSEYQEIVLTQSLDGRDVRMFLNGSLQFSTLDEYRYHESLIHPAMDGPREDVLVLGGGDGLAIRELLRYDDVDSVTLVDLDPAVIELASTHPVLRELNNDSFQDPRVDVVNTDAFQWLRDNPDNFDVVIADLPDGTDVGTSKLYTIEFYALLEQALNPDGRVVVQAGSPFFAPDAYWSVSHSLEEAGIAVTPYNVDVPTFGNWGFYLGASERESGRAPELTLPDDAPELRFLDDDLLSAALVFPKDRQEGDVRPSTLMHPRIIGYHQDRQAWRGY
ncbi:polyamine aminopropyltransferase 1 [Nocardiopsis terrae]|uniref:Polyamine aminopropyltransferase n=1 Tax=Nocardiopsis terrae TaxID=372655 RepID=A0ABR9HM49_9ACTN|nr:polyamine aminopropyltransferase [Nocardiopsis terrae]MBE1460119.1 spermidine synthase [Nocardiopsis terrae]GHC69801.1 polyamine aminopropyltransferase 1 [Nocardiopsis terrae]